MQLNVIIMKHILLLINGPTRGKCFHKGERLCVWHFKAMTNLLRRCPFFVFKLLPNEYGRPLSSFSDSETLHFICVIGQKVKRSHKYHQMFLLLIAPEPSAFKWTPFSFLF